MREELLSYWQKQLTNIPTVLELPLDHPRLSVQSFCGSRHFFTFPISLVQSLKALSDHEEGCTLFMILLAAFAVLLRRYSNQEQFIVGTPIIARKQIEMENLIGIFVNTLALPIDLSGNPRFCDLLVRIREITLEAYAHRDLPFEELVEELHLAPDGSRSPLVQVMFILQDTSVGAADLPGLVTTPMQVREETVRFDLTLELTETAYGFSGMLEYRSDLFEDATMARLVGHLQSLLGGIVTYPKAHISQLPLITEREQIQFLSKWNDSQIYYPQDICIHHLFEKQVKHAPEATAIVFEDQSLTYRELDQRANQLAHYLQSIGVGPDILIGLCLERSIEMIVGLLGILKAGGAYVPLDPTYPKDRLSFILQDAQVQVLLTQKDFPLDTLNYQGHIIFLDTDDRLKKMQDTQSLELSLHPENLAYVIYTSGSTSTPKGVAVTHRSAVAFLYWARTVFTPYDFSGVLAATSICFDLSIFELFAPLAWGGKVILVENVLHLPTVFPSHKVTLLNTVPSAIAALIRMNGIPASVCTVNIAGEPLPRTLVQQLYHQDTIQQVFNLYGPSEDTTYSTFSLVEKGVTQHPSIGRPISNTRAYVLDAFLQPVPIGVSGELYLSGAGLARGYLHRADLTAEHFLPHPFSSEPGARLYKTGDLVRYLPDGNLEFLGRLDHQVKIRGYRIELGEIETVLACYPAIRETIVVVHENSSGEKQLIAYIITRSQQPILISDLRSYLKKHLPDYMLPSAFVLLDAFPLTPNGKVDRRTLPQLGTARLTNVAAYTAPRTPVEEQLAEIWSAVLGIEKVGVYDNFFELGGHSLLATRIISRVRESFKITLSLQTLLENPTVEKLSSAMIAREVKPEQIQRIAQILKKVKAMSHRDIQIILNSKRKDIS